MNSFTYIVKDENGIHARPAGLLVREAQKFSSSAKISCGEKKGDLKKLFSLLSMNIKHDAEVTITIEGEDEDSAAKVLESFFNENL